MTGACAACGGQLAQVLIDAGEPFHVLCSPRWPPAAHRGDITTVSTCALCPDGVPDVGRGICPACDARTRTG